MPVSLPHALNAHDLLAVPASLNRRPTAAERIADWLKKGKQRRAERLLAQAICAAGIRDFSTHHD
jgi:hypothetical protein